MLSSVTFHGITIHQTSEAIHIQSAKTLRTLSSSFCGGGFQRVRHILNANVAIDYCSDTPADDLRAIAARCGVQEPFVGLLTAVPLHKARIVFAESGALRVGVVTTAGVGNATSAGVSTPYDATPGTINIIVLVDAHLTRSAMANAIITVTEAKSAVLNELNIRTPDGLPATGTSTDTVTVAATGLGSTQIYAGPATVLGWLIGSTVRKAVLDSLLAHA